MPKYADVFVSKELLERLKKDQDEAQGMARYGRFKAWLHYANLQSWQSQGWHFNYVNYMGKELHCTCGLVVPIDAEPEVVGLDELDLDPTQLAMGHRVLPALKGESVAIIYDYEWLWDKGVYFYKAVCQVCLTHTGLLPGTKADEFVLAHNQKCN